MAKHILSHHRRGKHLDSFVWPIKYLSLDQMTDFEDESTPGVQVHSICDMPWYAILAHYAWATLRMGNFHYGYYISGHNEPQEPTVPLHRGPGCIWSYVTGSGSACQHLPQVPTSKMYYVHSVKFVCFSCSFCDILTFIYSSLPITGPGWKWPDFHCWGVLWVRSLCLSLASCLRWLLQSGWKALASFWGKPLQR